MANATTVSGTSVSEDTAATSNHCLITGYIHDLAGDALVGYSFTVRYIHQPIGTGATTLFMRERFLVRAGLDGKVSFNLLQGAKVKFEIPGRMLDLTRLCNIPASTSANLLDILFPRVVTATFSQTTMSLGVGKTGSISVSGAMSDGTTLDVTGAVTLASASAGVATVEGTSITGVSAGTSNITISEIDLTKLSIGKEPDGDSIVRDSVPAAALAAPLVVTVG